MSEAALAMPYLPMRFSAVSSVFTMTKGGPILTEPSMARTLARNGASRQTRYRFTEKIIPDVRTQTTAHEAELFPTWIDGADDKTSLMSQVNSTLEALPFDKRCMVVTQICKSILREIRSSSEKYMDVSFSPMILHILGSGELLLEWNYASGRINFFIDRDLAESTVVYVKSVTAEDFPEVIENKIDFEDLPSQIAGLVGIAAELAR